MWRWARLGLRTILGLVTVAGVVWMYVAYVACRCSGHSLWACIPVMFE